MVVQFQFGIRRAATVASLQEAEIFVGVVGASNLTYAEATWTQQLPDWTGAHVRMFRFFGGVPKLLVPVEMWRGGCRFEPIRGRLFRLAVPH